MCIWDVDNNKFEIISFVIPLICFLPLESTFKNIQAGVEDSVMP
jgi:hypothetical protein